MKKIACVVFAAVFCASAPAIASGQAYWQGLNFMYNYFFGNQPFHWSVGSPIDPAWRIDETGGAYVTNPQWFYKLHVNNSSYIDTGTYGYEPNITLDGLIHMGTQKWSSVHPSVCSNTGAYRQMPIRNYQSDPSKFIVNQGVPFDFRAKSHGGLTKHLVKSYYFWNFGDGIRRFNKNKHDEGASHTYYQLGSYTLSSLVYSTEFTFGISIGGTTNADFSYNNSAIKPLLSTSSSLYLESCDSAAVKVVPNNAPVAKVVEVSRAEGARTSTITLSAAESTDPDNNPLSYTWKINGNTFSSSERVNVSYSTPEFGTSSYVISLTVSDGGKSSSTNHTIYVHPYCYSCNGFEIP